MVHVGNLWRRGGVNSSGKAHVAGAFQIQQSMGFGSAHLVRQLAGQADGNRRQAATFVSPPNGASRHCQHFRVLAGDFQQAERGTGGLPPAFLPTDRRHHRHIEHGGEDWLAHLQPCADACHVLRLSPRVRVRAARWVRSVRLRRPVTASRTCSTLRTSSSGLNAMAFFFMAGTVL